MTTGLIFDIKKYALHDGPGIRTTVFFKGCPLRCLWCHNPEGQSPFQELYIRSERCLETCHLCLEQCPQAAVMKTGQIVHVDRRKCRVCGTCASICPSEAMVLVGKRVTAEEVLEDVFRDEPFFRQSGGGVTFSGGEPLLQASFLNDLLEGCRRLGLSTALDTSVYAPWPMLDAVRKNVDLILYDLKVMENERHKILTGVPNLVIRENLRRLVECRSRIVVRLPLVAGLNDGADQIRAAAEWLSGMGGIERVDLLSYHALGTDKSRRLDRPGCPGDFAPPSRQDLERIRNMILDFGLAVGLGG